MRITLSRLEGQQGARRKSIRLQANGRFVSSSLSVRPSSPNTTSPVLARIIGKFLGGRLRRFQLSTDVRNVAVGRRGLDGQPMGRFTLMNLSRFQSLLQFARIETRATKRRVGRSRSVSPMSVETSEARQVMAGDVSGNVFLDTNVNGIDDPGEDGLAGWTVFVDSDGNGQFNAGEPMAVTDTRGRFAISGVTAAAESGSTKLLRPAMNRRPVSRTTSSFAFATIKKLVSASPMWRR